MDNAIEACKGVDHATIRFLSTMHKDNAFFVFQNTCQNPPPANKINEKGFTTKAGARGMGLYIATQLVRKNEHLFLKTKINTEGFTQELTVVPEL